MLSETIFESLRHDFKTHSFIFMQQEVEKYIKGKTGNYEDYIKETTKIMQILTAGAIPLLNAAIKVIENAKGLPEDFKKSLVTKMGLYAYETMKKEFCELLACHDIKTIEATISEWGGKAMLDILDDLEHVKNNEQRMRMKIPVGFPLKLEYDRIAFFPPTSEKIIHFQIIKGDAHIEYFAEETDFPRYRWMERSKEHLKEIGTFTIKNIFSKPIDNVGKLMNLNDLNAALENNDITLFLIALRAVVHVNGGIAYLADETGLHRETLYRTLSPDGNPTIKSLMLILDALNLKLHVEEKE